MAMISALAALLGVLVLAAWASQATGRTTASNRMVERHFQWMKDHRKAYKDEKEQARRFQIFRGNVEYIESFNNQLATTGGLYRLAVNGFADMTNGEFRARRGGYRASYKMSSPSSFFKYENVTEVPTLVDWRQKGAVTGVKDQGTCGSCWAFSAIAAIEGINQLKTGIATSFSEQELVDCDKVDKGCKDGFPESAFDFVLQSHGLATEANYPYQGADLPCNTASKLVPNVITGYEEVPGNNELALQSAVANQPVSVSIDAHSLDFQFYSAGVFTGASCGTNLDHSVVVVGYGETTEGINYWLVKNSYGAGWGEDGYMRILKDVKAKEGTCGIAMEPSYPTRD